MNSNPETQTWSLLKKVNKNLIIYTCTVLIKSSYIYKKFNINKIIVNNFINIKFNLIKNNYQLGRFYNFDNKINFLKYFIKNNKLKNLDNYWNLLFENNFTI